MSAQSLSIEPPTSSAPPVLTATTMTGLKISGSQRNTEPAFHRRLADRTRSWIYCNIQRPWRIHSAPYYFVWVSPHPIDTAIMLLWPYPWKYPVPPPLSVQYLLDNPQIIYNRRDTEINYVTMRKIVRFRQRDTPLRSLYRLYETVVASNEDEMMQESQYWFHKQPDWRLEDIPDPKDSDPIRYAILASLTDALVLSFNHKIKYGMRRGITDQQPMKILDFRNDPSPPLECAPSWCAQVGALSQVLVLEPGVERVIPDDLTVLPGPLLSDNPGPFARRNMSANFVQLYNI